MNQNIIKYFIENKEKYSKEILIAELSKAGYKKEEIAEAAKFVYEGAAPQKEASANFWNFKARKVYIKTSEKVVDFLLGFFVAGFVVWTIIWLLHLIIRGPLFFLSLIIYILALIYLYKRRRYMFYGLLADLLIPLAGIIFLFFVIGGF